MNKTLIIAEAGVNHNGDIDLAKKLIDTAADAEQGLELAVAVKLAIYLASVPTRICATSVLTAAGISVELLVANV